MSEVWLAEDQRLGRWVAVKILRDSVADANAGALVDSIEREARVIARLQHPNIVAVYDAGKHEGHHFLVMEYVHGFSLRQLLEMQRRMTEAEAIRYGTQVASALQYAHDQGVIHCDVKPENILVNENGVAKVADFGVADTVTRTLGPEQARAILGTVAYLAPEVIQGFPADGRSDIYSLALTVYEMVATRLPFAGSTPAAIAGQRLAVQAPLIRSITVSASPEIEAVLARALSLMPYDRHQSAGEFGAALRRVETVSGRAGAPAVPTPPGRPPRPPARRRRHSTAELPRGVAGSRRGRRSGAGAGPIWGGILAAVLGIGAASAAAYFVLGSRDSDDPQRPTPTVVPAPTFTPTVRPTEAPTPTATLTRAASPSPSPSPSPGPRPSVSASPAGTPKPSPSAGATASPSAVVTQ